MTTNNLNQPITPLQQSPSPLPNPILNPIPNPTTPTPATPNTTANQPVNKPKKGGTGKKIFFSILIILTIFTVIGLSLAGGYIYSRLKKSYIPFLSPIFEDELNTPSEQLAIRLDAYNYILNKGQADSQIDFLSSINSFFTDLKSIDSEIEMKFTYDYRDTDNVLGLDIIAGKVDDQKLSEMLTSQSGEMDLFVNTKSSISSLVIMNSSKIQAKLNASNNEIGAELDMVNKVSPSENNAYINLSKFPENPYIFPASILNKWIKIDLSSLNQNLPLNNEDAEETNQWDSLKNELPRLKQLITTTQFSNALSIKEPKYIEGQKIKCYNLHIDKDNYTSLLGAIVEVYGNGNTSSLDYTNGGQIPSTDVEFCFDDLLMIRRVGLLLSFQSNDESPIKYADLDGYFQINSFNQDYNILEPTTSIDIADVDLENIFPSYYENYLMMDQTYEFEYNSDLEYYDDFEDIDLEYQYYQ